MSNPIEEKNNKKYLRISVSKAKTFGHCKKQFKFSYIDRLPKITRDYHVLGTFCHAVLENFHRSYIDGSLQPFNIELTIAWKKAVQDTKNGLTTEIKKEARGLIDGYLKKISERKKNGQVDKVIDVERNFKVDLDGRVLLNGMIDRIQLDEDNVIHVADYKSTKNEKYLKNDFFQLLTYAYVILADDPSLEKIRASYILLRHDFQYITIEFSREEIEKIHDEFLEIADEMNAETEYPANPTPLCNWCDFVFPENGDCQEGQEFIANRKTFQKIDKLIYGAVKW